MSIEDAYQKALKRLGLDEIPPYASRNPAVVWKRIEYTSMVGLILREERAKEEIRVMETRKLEEYV